MDQINSRVAWRRHRRWWLGLLIVALAATGVRAQQIFRTSTDAVVLTVTVTDAQGRLVAGLEQEDFQVFEDQVPQEITNFSRQPQPIALSLVIDTSASMESKLPIAQEAAMGFVRRMGPEDRIQIIDFDSTAKILEDFSSNREALERAIKKTEAGGSTSLYNAAYMAISDLRRIGQAPGPENRRYALVLLSDGEDTSSIVPYDDVLELAKRAGVVVYAIGLREKLKPGASHTTGWKQAEYNLKQLAVETGGLTFFADDVSQLPTYYSQIADELSNQYTLGYTSKNGKRDGAWRKILVRVSRPSMTARTKAGYFGPTVGR
jgi:Ca-activated chloride channel family protein